MSQDWEVITFRKPPPPPKERASAPRRPSEDAKHMHITHDIRMALQQARAARGVTQKQLAGMLNVQPAHIAAYEAGKTIPNNAFLANVERTLGTKLPRAKKPRVDCAAE